MKRTIFILVLQLSAILPAAEPVREIPPNPWVKIYFATIDRVTAQGGLSRLREDSPRFDHVEARFWFGFGLGGLSGIVIQRKEGKWSASELREDAHQKQVETTRLEPRKSWDHAWATLEEKGLLTLPDFSTLPPSDYAVLDGSSIVVEVFTTGKYRTYMYPNPGQFDNPECRLIEILTATLMKEIRRGDGRVNGRSFLSAQEVRKLGDKIYALKYPLPITDFLKTLPIDLAARGLRSDGSSGDEGISWKEWPLTSRVEPRGYFALVAFTQAKGFRDHEGENTVRHAEVVFHDRNLFQSLVLQPSDYPTRRSPEPPSVK